MNKLIVFLWVLLLSLPALAEQPLSIETRQVPINRGINNYCNFTDSMVSLNTTSHDGSHMYYDLSGRKIVAPTVKGIYIFNGKKVVK